MGKNYFHQYLTFTKLFLNNFFITHCYRLFYFSKIRFLESRLTTRILQSKQFVVGTTYAFQNASVLDVRYSYSKIDAGKRPPLIGGESPFELYGITGLPDDPEANGGLTTQTIAGLSQLGRQATNPQFQNPTNQDLARQLRFRARQSQLKNRLRISARQHRRAGHESAAHHAPELHRTKN